MRIRCALGVGSVCRPLLGGIIDSMSLTTVDATRRARSAADWREDILWHRQMYRQSRFRWAAENATNIAMRSTRGRLEFSTPKHLAALEVHRMELLGYTDQIRLAMASPLREARSAYGARWGTALALVGMSTMDARIIIWSAVGTTPDQVTNTDVRRVLRGIPLPNPLTEVWELRQLHSMFQAASDLLEDAVCDLVHELSDHHGLDALAPLTVSSAADQLRMRIEAQREQRGEPGDRRRIPQQRY
ncbi:hypothetical protein GCM10009616_34210 [Microlunatus lacustris]